MNVDQKIGPLKTWQWGLIVVSVGLLYWYEKKKSGTQEVLNPTESFATGNPIGQGTEGSGGVGVSEQAIPAPSEPHNTEVSTAPGLGAGQLFATELEEVGGGIEALEKTGLIPPRGALATVTAQYKKSEKEKAALLAKQRKKPTHAKQGTHHHAKSTKHKATHVSGSTGKAEHKSKSEPSHSTTVHHASAHHKRKKK